MEADAIDDIMVRVRASGYALISHYLEESLILELDPKFLRPLSADSDTFLVYVSEVKDIIEKKLLEESISSVENFTTEFVRVILPKIDTKKVPVVAQSEVKYYPQYMATSQMKLTPDSVLIYGEDALVEKTDAVYTKVISGQNVSESFQGVAVGLSLPLWNNSSKVKQSKAQLLTSETMLDGTRNECYNTYKTLYNQSLTLQQNADKLAATLSRCNSEALLQKALDAGEISLLEYLLEIEFYQQAAINTLAAQRDAQMALAELFAMDL
jgi:hypothetical protein